MNHKEYIDLIHLFLILATDVIVMVKAAKKKAN